MEQLQWHSFEKKIYLKSTLENIYQLWATPTGITSWFLKSADYYRNSKPLDQNEFVKSGDAYMWCWHNWDGKEEGTILEANGKDHLEFSFANSKVAINLEAQNDVVLVSLKQFEIPEDEASKLRIHFGCSNGWTFWLTNLKAYVEHGILLNETEIDLRDQDLAGWVFVNM